MSSYRRLAPFLAGLVVIACDCEKPLQVATGQVRWEWETKDGPQAGETALIDFGTISMGSQVQQLVFVRNIGRGSFSLSDFVKVAGDAVTVQNRLEAGAAFALTFEQDRQVFPAERLPITITFAPPVRLDVRSYDVGSQQDFVAAGAPNAPLELKGRAISGECEVPDTIDFGIVPVGTMTSADLNLSNDSSIPVQVTTGQIVGVSAGIFVVTGLDASGGRAVASGEAAQSTITFTPTETRDYVGRMTVRRTQSCPERDDGVD